MEISSSNYGYYFDTYQRSYPPEFHGSTGYAETHVQLADEVSQGDLGEICFRGVRIHYGRFQTLKTDTIRTTEDFPSVEMLFQLQGRTSQQSAIQTHSATQQPVLSYRPYSDIRSRFEAGSHHHIGIQLTETFFSRFADDDSATLTCILNSIAQRKATAFLTCKLRITPALLATLTQLTQPTYRQPLKRLYLETTVLDLLRQQIEQADADLTRPPTELKAGDIDKIMAVKELLDLNPLESYSLLQLSRFAGLNDYKLKKGFRELFGTTVFGHLNELRMNYAHQLLRDTNQSIGKIAHTLGYSETHHFSTAFKRRFKHLPSQVNRFINQ